MKAKDRAKEYWKIWVSERRTTIIGIANILFFLSGCLMLYVGKFTVTDLAVYLGLANSTVFSTLAFFAADGKKATEELKELHKDHKGFY